MPLNDALIKLIAEHEDELKTLRKRVAEQRKDIANLLAMTERLVQCHECIYCENGKAYGYEDGANYCRRSFSASHGVLDDDFCSMGQKKRKA